MASNVGDLTNEEMRSVERDIAALTEQAAKSRNEETVSIRAVTLQALLDTLAHVE